MTHKKLLLSVFILTMNLLQSSAQPHTLTGIFDTLHQPNFYRNGNAAQLTSGYTLNSFFTKKIGSYLSEAADLSANTAFAVLDNKDNKLFVGGSVSIGKSGDFNRWIFSGGLKANTKSGFANLLNTNEIENEVGISAKLTFFGRGSIFWWKDDEKTQQEKKAQSFRDYQFSAIESEYRTTVSSNQNHLQNIATNNYAFDTARRGSLLRKHIQKKEKELAQKFIDEEVSNLDNEKLYNLAHTWWVSLESYVPVSDWQYNVSSNLQSTALMKVDYRPWTVEVSHSHLWERKNRWFPGTVLLTVTAGISYNNTVLNQSLKKYSYEKWLSQATNGDTSQQAKLDAKDVYVGNFEKFVTPQIGGRFVYLYNGKFGLSAGVEKNFGRFDFVDWRLGIPVSLKDKEGKPKINFELLWRQIANDHSVGLSVGLPIGGSIF